MKLESVLKERYVELCGMTDKRERNSGGEISNSKDGEDESIDGYDRFACDDVIEQEIIIVGVQRLIL